MIPVYKDEKFIGSAESVDGCLHRELESTEDTCSEGCCDYYYCVECESRILVECPD